jgi:anti-sigma factor RsiW/HEAT repeat protein
MSCGIDEERLSLLADGELPPDEARELEAHVASCERCQAAHERLLRLASLYRATHEPVRTPTDFAVTTMEKLAAVRTRRARGPRRRRLLVLTAAAAVAATLLIVALLGGPSGRGEGLLLRLEDDGWMWAGPSAPIRESCVYASPAAPARIAVEGTDLWLEAGTFLRVESLDPVRVHLVSGGVLAWAAVDAGVDIRTPAGLVRGEPGSRFAVRTAPPGCARELHRELFLGDGGSSLGSLLLPDAHAGASVTRPVAADCIAGRVVVPGGTNLRTGMREVRRGDRDRILRGPFDPAKTWWQDLQDRLARSTTPAGPATLLELLGDSESELDVEALLAGIGPGLVGAETSRMRSWMTGENARLAGVAAVALLERGELDQETRRDLVQMLEDPSRPHGARAAAVVLLAALTPRKAESALTRVAASGDRTDLRLVAAWGLIGGGLDVGTEVLQKLMASDASRVRDIVDSVPHFSDALSADAWRALANSEDVEVRERAIRMLGTMGDARDHGRLRGIMMDARESRDIRVAAASALSWIQPPFPPLQAAALLSELPVDVARPLLFELRLNPDPEIRRILLENRERFPDHRDQILIEAARTDDTAREELIRSIETVRTLDLHSALLTIHRHDPEAGIRLALAELEQHRLGSLRGAASLRLLADAAAPRALPLVLTRLDEAGDDEEGVLAARIALAQLAAGADLGPKIGDRLIDLLPDAPDALRGAICDALARTGDEERANAALARYARRGSSPAVSRRAVRALGKRGGRRAIAILADLARDAGNDRALVLEVLLALAEMGEFPSTLRTLPFRTPEIELWAAAGRLAANPDLSPEDLATAYRAVAAQTRRALLSRWTLALRRAPHLRRPLISLASEDADPYQRLWSLSIARNHGDPELEPLRDRLALDPHWAVRLSAGIRPGITARELGMALVDTPPFLSSDLRYAVRKALGGWRREDDPTQLNRTPVAEHRLRLVLNTLLRQEEIPESDTDGPERSRGARVELASVTRIAARLHGESAPSDTTTHEIYRGLAESLRRRVPRGTLE